jgi:nucleotide-binding universal stress UspA family protein
MPTVAKEKTLTKPVKLLIGYDGSPYADTAIDDLRHAGLPQEVEAIVLSVADLWILPSDETTTPPSRLSTSMTEARAAAAKLMEEAKLLANRGRDRVQSMFPQWQVSAETAADSPAWAIILKAEEWHVDLIVVGSHGYSPIERIVLGSVSQTVLTHARCSVRVARASSTEPGEPLRILVAVDGSMEADAAVRTVAERMWPAGTNVRIVTAVNPSLLSAITSAPLPAEQEAAATDENVQNGNVNDRIEKLLEDYKAIVSQNGTGLTVSTQVMSGDPKRILVNEAERWGADSIFMGSRGLNRLERLLLGSVSTAVASRAHCSVEVVRPANV